MHAFVKRRDPAAPGSIPEALQTFHAEVRFYREVAPEVGVRVPACYDAVDDAAGTRLVLEDLSSWALGADPADAARLLSDVHRRWEGLALERWPWLRRGGDAADLVGDLFDRTWPRIAARYDVSPRVRDFGERLVRRVPGAVRDASGAGPLTLVHGDASTRNLRTGPAGEIAFLDWEDLHAAPGVTDLSWLLLSSVPPAQWDDVVHAYRPARRLGVVLPAAIVQGLLSFGDTAAGSAVAAAWIHRLEAGLDTI